MFLMFILGAIVIVAGYSFDHTDFTEAILRKEGKVVEPASDHPFDWLIFLKAGALMFSSFIGFDSIAQAGGEASKPGKNIPRAITISILTVGTYYILFSGASLPCSSLEFHC